MVSVALPALGPFVLLKRLFVFAAVKQAGVARVTLPATLAYARQANRHGRVIAMTVVARRCAQIATLQQRAAVYAGPVFRQLIGGQRRTVGQFEAGHPFSVGVANAAGFVDAFWVNRRERIFCAADAVNSMATQAVRGTRVFGLQQQLAVRAFLVLRQLVGGQSGIKLVHERRIGMAAGAERKNPATVLVTARARPFLDKRMFELVTGRITTMATGAGQPATKMNIIHQIAQI